MLNVAMVGCGAIGAGVLQALRNDAFIRFSDIIVSEQGLGAARGLAAELAPDARVVSRLDAAPDVLLECAGHGAIEQHVIAALERGISCLLVSTGALAQPGLVEQLAAAAQRGGAQVQFLAGAIGAIDALAAARIGGLDRVEYTGRKPPSAWQGTPAQQQYDLDGLSSATEIFSGSAREAARLYPKNANVAATLAFAGLGLDQTRVRLLADPGVADNVHQVQASGAFGSFELTLRGRPLAANPKTSALTVFSAVRGLTNRAHALII